jgi:hypothetical protein
MSTAQVDEKGIWRVWNDTKTWDMRKFRDFTTERAARYYMSSKGWMIDRIA